MDYTDFAAKVKAKHPEYSDMGDYDLAQKMVKKFPAYGDVDFTSAPETPSKERTYKKYQVAPESKLGLALQAGKDTLSGDVPVLSGIGNAVRHTIPEAIAGAGEKIGLPKTGAAIGAGIGTAGEFIPQTGGQLAVAGLAGPVLEGAAAVAKPVTNKAAQLLAQKFGGVSEYAGKILDENAPAVMKYARMGLEKATDAAAAAGKTFQNLVPEFEKKLSKDYVEGVVEKGIKDKGATTFDFSSRVQPAFDQAREYTLDDTEKKTLDKLESKFQSSISRQGSETLGGSAPAATTVEDAWKFQKSLNKEIGIAAKSPNKRALYGALLDIKGGVMDSLETPFPELAQGNANYREGRALAKELHGLANADDAIGKINSALRRRTNLSDSITKFTEEFPQAKQALTEATTASAGREFARWSRYLTNTGLAAGAGAAAVGAVTESDKIMSHPKTAATLAAMALGSSPRLMGELGAATYGPLSKGAGMDINAGTAFSTQAIRALLAQRQKDNPNGK